MATTTADGRTGGGEHPGRARAALARLLLLGAIFTWFAGTMLGFLFEWEPGLVLYVPAGVLLALWTTLIGAGVIEPETDAAPLPVFVLIGGLCALAAVGFGLEQADGDGPWSLLMLPAIVVGGVWCLRTALSNRLSRAFHERSGSSRPYWGVRAGLLMFGLAWPFFALEVLGLID